ncbi:hypothetical protein T4D_1437 [Trichinella pseudospiralis]|uniref:Uncharacterized protein n=1 Tax=Trichinella pseudospiralis TaxID=6337 RepID=A0A0V1F7Y4_TRIPS|nr:hypothetical protein T4D_1437 [Trichinella pseudospiralis]
MGRPGMTPDYIMATLPNFWNLTLSFAYFILDRIKRFSKERL